MMRVIMSQNNYYVFVLLDPRKTNKVNKFVYEYEGREYIFRNAAFFAGMAVEGIDGPKNIIDKSSSGEYKHYVFDIVYDILHEGLEPIVIKYIDNISREQALNEYVFPILHSLGIYWKVKQIPAKRKKDIVEIAQEELSAAAKRSLTMAENDSNAQVYIVYDPSNIRYKVKNLKKFCDANNVDYYHLQEVSRGNKVDHNGWRCYKHEDDEEEIYKKALERINRIEDSKNVWTCVSPKGKVFTTENLGEFCKKHNLTYVGMEQVAYGFQKTHRNWTCSKKKKKDIKQNEAGGEQSVYH